MGGERGCLKMRDQKLYGGVEEIPVQEFLGIPSNLVGLYYESILPGEEKSMDASLPNFPIRHGKLEEVNPMTSKPRKDCVSPDFLLKLPLFF